MTEKTQAILRRTLWLLCSQEEKRAMILYAALARDLASSQNEQGPGLLSSQQSLQLLGKRADILPKEQERVQLSG
jgi:ribosome biogenesis GTPase A